MVTQEDTDWEVGLKCTQLDEEKQKENRKAEQKEKGQNEAEWTGCVWLPLVQFNPSEGHAAARQISTMMLWLNSVPSPNMQYNTHTHKERSMLTTSVHTMLKACWEITIQILTFVHTHLCDAPGSTNARKHTLATGRLGAYCCDWRETHSCTRCVCDRPGLGRWRWGTEEALGRENREQRNTQHSTLRVLHRIQKHSNPANPESSVQRRQHSKLQNVPKQERFEQNNTAHQISSRICFLYHWLMCLVYRFGYSIKYQEIIKNRHHKFSETHMMFRNCLFCPIKSQR